MPPLPLSARRDRKSTRLNSSHVEISYAVFCLKKKNRRGLLRPCDDVQEQLILRREPTLLPAAPPPRAAGPGLRAAALLPVCVALVFFCSLHPAHQDLHSFPTRRSSD